MRRAWLGGSTLCRFACLAALSLSLSTSVVAAQESVSTEQLQKRLAELRSEREDGRKKLADLEARKASLEQVILRIDGAIQVLEEFLEYQ